MAGSVNDAEVTKLVTAAAGLDPKRGDVVTVSELAFDTQAAAAAKKELDAAAADKQRADLFNMAKTGGLSSSSRSRSSSRSGAAARRSAPRVDLGELPRSTATSPQRLEGAPLAMAVTSATTAPALPPAPANALVASNLQARNEIGQLIERAAGRGRRACSRGWLVDRRP